MSEVTRVIRGMEVRIQGYKSMRLYVEGYFAGVAQRKKGLIQAEFWFPPIRSEAAAENIDVLAGQVVEAALKHMEPGRQDPALPDWRQLVLKAGFKTNTQLARHLNVSISLLQRVTGSWIPTIQQQIADVLGVQPQEVWPERYRDGIPLVRDGSTIRTLDCRPAGSWRTDMMERGFESFSSFGREIGVATWNLSKVQHCWMPETQSAIAKALGRSPEEYWPERYRDGHPLERNGWNVRPVPSVGYPELPTDWHPLSWRQLLRERGFPSQVAFAAACDSRAGMLSTIDHVWSPQTQSRMAVCLGVHPKVLWPDRYDDEGHPVKRPRAKREVLHGR